MLRFIATIEMVDGKSVVTWTPDLNKDGTKSVRAYKTWGKDSLEADEWLDHHLQWSFVAFAVALLLNVPALVRTAKCR